MRLAFDVTSAVKPEPTGTARYAVELLRALLRRLSAEDRVVLGFRLSRWHRREHAPRFDDPRVTLRPLQSPLAFLTYGAPDVFHGLGVNVPLGLPRSTRRFVTIHGFVEEEGRRKRLAKIATMLGRADRGFVVSEHERERTAALCACSPEKLAVVYHGVDHERFKPEGQRVQRRPFVLFLGAITDVKNVATLLEGFARSRARRDFELVLAGQARSESAAILARIAPLGLEGSVHVAGHVSPEDVPSWIRAARALVHPSRYESFGLPVLEAMACGTPVACSSGGALPEVTAGAARLFDAASAEDLASALDAVAFDESVRADLRARGLARAAGFTWDRAAERTLAVYGVTSP